MQKFRGLDPRTQLARWGLLGLALGVLLGGTAPNAANAVARALDEQAGSLAWFASRTAGFLAYLAIVGSVGYGLLLSTGALDVIAHRPISFTLHRDLALAGLVLSAVHGGLLILDSTIPFSIGQLVIPFASPYQPFWVGMGQLGFLLTIVVVASFWLRRRIGQRTWRLLHYGTFAIFVFTTAHGLASGTDSAALWAWWIYVGSAALVTGLLVTRIALSLATRRSVTRPTRFGPATASPGRPRGTDGRGSATEIA